MLFNQDTFLSLAYADDTTLKKEKFDLGKGWLTFWSMGMKNLIHPGQ